MTLATAFAAALLALPAAAETTPPAPSPTTPDVAAAARALRMAAGFSAAQRNDVSTLEMTSDDQVNLTDAFLDLRVPATGPKAVWSMAFPANGIAMPALADVDGDGHTDAVFSMGTINGTNFADPNAANNPNAVYVLGDLSGSGGYGVQPGWPRPLRDAPTGIALGASAAGKGMDVFASNFQDNGTPSDPKNLYCHLYGWGADGAPLPSLAPAHLDSPNGLGFGHANAAPVVCDVLDGGEQDALFACLGKTIPELGGEVGGYLQAVRPDGSDLFRTQSADAGAPWYTSPALNDSEFPTPPLVPAMPGGHAVIAASYSGIVYGWNAKGEFLPGFPVYTDNLPKSTHRATIQNAIAGADLDGDGHFEVIAGSGSIDNTDLYGINDGAVYCWSDAGKLLWRYPAAGVISAMSSGIAVGRIQGNDKPPCIVVGDAAGYVLALDAKGSLLWKFTLPASTHPAYRPVLAQPLIADVDGDGVQDVIIGTANGGLFALKGVPATAAGEVIWKQHTYRAPDSIFKGKVEQRFEEVRGLAVGALNAAAPDHATLLVTTGRSAVTIPNPVGGHAFLLDLGPATWNPAAADWPQFQQNAQRAGMYKKP